MTLKKTHIKEKLEKLKSETERLQAIEKQVLASPDKQISLTDPDSRSMATSGRGSGVVGYNVQTAVDTENHLIVAHEVTNVGSDGHNWLRPRPPRRRRCRSTKFDVSSRRDRTRTGEAARGRIIVAQQDTTEINFAGREAPRKGLAPAGNGYGQRLFHPPRDRRRCRQRGRARHPRCPHLDA